MEKRKCYCCEKGSPKGRPCICPECGHEFRGKGWEGIDAHWRARHEEVMTYEAFWASLCQEHKEMDEMKLIRQMISDTEESIAFFSNPKKPDRERAVCAAFLRCLGIQFEIADLEICKSDPPDMHIKGANFEIKEYLEDGRRRHEQYKNRLEKLKTAKGLSDLMMPYTSPQPLTIAEVCERITKYIEEYARSYNTLCATLDLLVYFNLNDYYINDEDSSVSVLEMKKQGWRSVSMIDNSSAFVFFASESAPLFLRSAMGVIKREWKESGLFSLS